MRPENPLDKQAKKLEQAIQNAMLDSPDIRKILCDLKTQGLSPDVWLIMGISLAQIESDSRETTEIASNTTMKMTPEDLDFIRSIKVRWDSQEPR